MCKYGLVQCGDVMRKKVVKKYTYEDDGGGARSRYVHTCNHNTTNESAQI